MPNNKDDKLKRCTLYIKPSKPIKLNPPEYNIFGLHARLGISFQDIVNISKETLIIDK